MNKQFQGLLICMAIGTSAFSQEVISANGSELIGAGVQLDYTVGELVVSNETGAGVNLENGFHHANILIVTADADYWNEPETEVFPNPVSSQLKVQSELDNLSFRVISANGTAILEGELTNDDSIDMSSLNTGAYIIQLFNQDQQKSIQITKK